MSDGRHILRVLKESGTSRFIRELTPDALVPSITKAVQIVEEKEEDIGESTNSRILNKERVFHTPRTVSYGCHFAYTIPEKRQFYRTLLKSPSTHAEFDLNMDADLEKLLSGESVYYDVSKGIFPYSLAYAGFQFGDFAGQLGDGRVVNLFDIKDSKGTWQTLQLKGSGLTPFSRFADGKAVLRSSIREFIISEALYNIGIPSTRALQIALLPKTKAQRGMKAEPTAVVSRVAPSWIRLGSFDLFRWKPDLKGLFKLSDFVISDIFSHGKDFSKNLDINIFKKDFFPDNDDEPKDIKTIEGITQYDLFFRHVATLNARCVAYWQAYGFLNGVLNTDNISVLGISMDFGPFNFLDQYDPSFTPNHDDITGRYSYENQPGIIWWNIVQFAQSLSILIGAGKKHIRFIQSLQDTMGPLEKDVEKDIVERANNMIKAVNNEYKFSYFVKYVDIMAKRLGIDLQLPREFNEKGSIELAVSSTTKFCKEILDPLLSIIKRTKIDYNNFFIHLQNTKISNFDLNHGTLNGLNKEFASIFFNDKQIRKLVDYYNGNKRLLISDSGETRLLTEIFDDLISWTENYSKYIMDSEDRTSIAKSYNPLFIPRSWILQEVIDEFVERQKDQLDNPVSELDTSLLKKIYLMSSNPYNPEKWDSSLKPEVEQKWTDIGHSDDSSKVMQKASCSS